MQNQVTKISIRQRGYTLVELLIALILIGIAVSAVIINMPSVLATVEPESVMLQAAELMFDARATALRGVASENERTFRIEDVLELPHSGMEITATPSSYGVVNCNSNACPGQQTICVSGQVMCFTPSTSFTFDRFSGKLAQSHAMFVTNKKRQLGLMVSGASSVTVVELVNGQWHSRTDLQDLILATQKVKEQPNK